MARTTQLQLSTPPASVLLVPGIIVGAAALTRLPFALTAGLAFGFAAGWMLRGEQSGRAERRDRVWQSDHEPQDGGTMDPDEKVDDMAEDSFPASDPPSFTATRTGKPRSRP